ncbi:glycosyltransferase family 69 protein [Hygrophoropsis aurantiaca]|uniref:Glycosyltransferase family 69 protein n=1 Tax=Hygrophoropsis aurantiaca TaxID=72124 RepID=A0ACB8A5F2_9AGAM|nr:glycosyltransferase family 69 protein [Hygrophoropsis aurantiaca]
MDSIIAFIILAGPLCLSVVPASWKQYDPKTSAPGYILLQADSREEATELVEQGGQNQHPFRDVEEGNEASSRPTSTGAFNYKNLLRNQTRQWWTRVSAYLVILFVAIGIGAQYEQPGDSRFRPAINAAVAFPNSTGYARQERIFFAAMFSNNEAVIPYWAASLMKAIHYLGTDNVFVSILESNSHDRSPQLLRDFAEMLAKTNVAHRVLTDDTAVERSNWVDTNMERINFLSAVRNRAIEPLVEKGGYDKLVFSNDIYIEPETIIELLETADGNYDMACGLDFGSYGGYDAWVLRDRQGKLTSTVWPYFFDEVDYRGMQVEAPIPVFSCWNGIIVARADPLIPIHLRSNHTLSTEPLPYSLPTTHPAAHNASLSRPSPALTPAIRFRASASEECFSSESFLLPYDLRRQFDMQRIFVNPRVITAYKWRYYMYFKWFLRHPLLKWWIQKLYDVSWMRKNIKVVGNPAKVWWWDGGDCHPFA